MSLAIGLHNIPEGLAVATVLVSRGVGPKKAAWWALFTALPQPLLAVPSFMFVDTFTFLLPLALGFAAGCMTWMVFAELIPDSLADAPHGKVRTTLQLARSSSVPAASIPLGCLQDCCQTAVSLHALVSTSFCLDRANASFNLFQIESLAGYICAFCRTFFETARAEQSLP